MPRTHNTAIPRRAVAVEDTAAKRRSTGDEGGGKWLALLSALLFRAMSVLTDLPQRRRDFHARYSSTNPATARQLFSASRRRSSSLFGETDAAVVPPQGQ